MLKPLTLPPELTGIITPEQYKKLVGFTDTEIPIGGVDFKDYDSDSKAPGKVVKTR